MFYTTPLPLAQHRHPTLNPFLDRSYLPDTYFPHTKRPLSCRPFNPEIDSVTGYPNKRRKVCSTPVDHRELCELKKLERLNAKQQESSTACLVHRTYGLPLQVYGALRRQEGRLGRMEELQGVVLEEVCELSRIVKSIVGDGKLGWKKATDPTKNRKEEKLEFTPLSTSTPKKTKRSELTVHPKRYAVGKRVSWKEKQLQLMDVD